MEFAYSVRHSTTYRYETMVSLGNHVACLIPRSLAGRQECMTTELHISPVPATLSERTDYFGNRLSFFSIQEPHKQLVVEADSKVKVGVSERIPHRETAWEDAVEAMQRDRTPEHIMAQQFVFESPRIRIAPQFAAYARQSF